MFKKFNLVIETDFPELAGIHPLMQANCEKLCKMFQNEKGFLLGVFGSSVTANCGIFSDLDLVIRLYGDDVSSKRFYDYSRAISLAGLSVETDVIFYNELRDGELLKEEIKEHAYPLIYSDDIIPKE